MAITKRILITTERHDVLIVRQSGRKTNRGWCPQCLAEVEMLSFVSSLSFFGSCAREFIRQIESGVIHSIEDASGHLLICLKSLEASEKENS